MNSRSSRPAFLPLDPEIDASLEQLARAKGVGRLERPAVEEKGAQQTVITESPEPENSDTSGLDSQATPRSRMKSLNLELPDYAWTEIKIRAAQRQTSLRHVVMAALVADGITISDADMIEDGRRLR